MCFKKLQNFIIRDVADRKFTDIRREQAVEAARVQALREKVRETVALIDESKARLGSPREKGAEEKALGDELAKLQEELEEARKERNNAGQAEDDEGWTGVEGELDRDNKIEELETAAREKGAGLGLLSAKADGAWADELAIEEGILESHNGSLAELIKKAGELTGSRIAAVRREAAQALIDAKDAASLVRFCYEEMDPEAREAAFMKAVEVACARQDGPQISMGMRLGRDERSMLLRMVEDREPAISSLAWKLAVEMMAEGKLDGEQVEYLDAHANEMEDDELRGVFSSKRAGIWVEAACSGEGGMRASALAHTLEAMLTGLKLDDDQKCIVLELTENLDADVSRQAWLVAWELCRGDELTSEQMAELARRANRIEDMGRRANTMAALFDLVPRGMLGTEMEFSLAMAAAGNPNEWCMDRGLARAMEILMKKELTREQVEGFLVLVDSMDNGRLGNKKPRLFECVRQAFKPADLTDKSVRILNVPKFSKIFLEVVKAERPGGVRRKSQPPGADGNVAGPHHAEKVPTKG